MRVKVVDSKYKLPPNKRKIAYDYCTDNVDRNTKASNSKNLKLNKRKLTVQVIKKFLGHACKKVSVQPVYLRVKKY